jgi:ureidoglycolate hydrolase
MPTHATRGPEAVPLEPLPLSAEAWAPFGVLPAEEGSSADRGELRFAWDDPHVNLIRHTLDEVGGVTGDRLRCEVMFRHRTHTQVLMPLDADAVMVVAPAFVAFDRRSDLAAAAAFCVRRLEAVVLAPGTWHWGPFPLDASEVRCFNVQGRRYREDNEAAGFRERLGVVFEVPLGPARQCVV